MIFTAYPLLVNFLLVSKQSKEVFERNKTRNDFSGKFHDHSSGVHFAGTYFRKRTVGIVDTISPHAFWRIKSFKSSLNLDMSRASSVSNQLTSFLIGTFVM